MRRREFIALIGSAATALPFAARAQQRTPLVGFLNSASPDTYRFNADSFREGLAKAGFVEGRMFALRNDGPEAIMRPCRSLLPSLCPWAWPPLQPPETLLRRAPRNSRAVRCRWFSRLAVTLFGLG
jgi:hypothetical protein